MAGCAASTAPLNSDAIHQKFGSYGIDVLEDDGRTRRSSLYSLHDGTKVCRTYAVVRYLPLSHDVEAQIQATAAQVRAGASMGETFRSAGWRITKVSLYIGSLTVPPGNTKLRELMHVSGNQTLSMQVYRFQVARNSASIDFAEIIEVHHPDYLGPGELRERATVDAMPAPTAADIIAWQNLALAQ